MMDFYKARYQNGQALVEAVVVVGLVTVMAVGLLSLATTSLKASRYGKAKALSVRYAQEGIEVVRGARNLSWSVLYACADTTPLQWCLNSPVASISTFSSCNSLFTAQPPNCTSFGNEAFKRTVALTQKDANTIQVKSTVSWTDGSSTYTTEVSSELTSWR